MKLFWEAVGTSKRNGTGTDETITKGMCREYFRRQYVIGDLEVRTENLRMEKKGEEKLQEILTEEVRQTIKRLKRKKAAGQDAIPNEAWIFGQEELAEDLKNVLNRI